MRIVKVNAHFLACARRAKVCAVHLVRPTKNISFVSVVASDRDALRVLLEGHSPTARLENVAVRSVGVRAWANLLVARAEGPMAQPMHQAGFCHLDVKPSNVFLFEEACYLGDYGAAVKTGGLIRERTRKYYPTDGDIEASEETDMYLLAVTLLEMFGTIPHAAERSPMAKQEIREKIASVENDEVRTFLNSLFDGHLKS